MLTFIIIYACVSWAYGLFDIWSLYMGLKGKEGMIYAAGRMMRYDDELLKQTILMTPVRLLYNPILAIFAITMYTSFKVSNPGVKIF